MAQDYEVVQDQLSNSAAQIGSTVPTGQEYLITKLTLTNTNTVAETVSIWLAADGAASGTANLLFKDRSIAAGDTVSLNVSGHAMPPGSKLYGVSATNAVVNVYATFFKKLVAGF